MVTPLDSPVDSQHSSTGSIWWAVFGLTVLAAVLRLYHIGVRALIFDEAFSLWIARHPLQEALSLTAHFDDHPPLYYSLLHFFRLAFGEWEGMLRLPSTLCGILTVPFAYWLGRIVNGHRLGMLTALLVVISPYNVQYGQTARMYTLLMLAATVAMVGFAGLLRCPEAAALPLGVGWRSLRRARGVWNASDRTMLAADAAWLGYVMGTTTALWSQYTAILLPLATNVVVLVSKLHRDPGRGFSRNWLLAHFTILLLCIPLLSFLARQWLEKTIPGNFAWVPVPDLRILAGTAQVLYVAFLGHPSIQLLVIDFVGLGLVGLGLWGWRRECRWIVFTSALGLVPFVSEFIISVAWHPVFLSKTLIWISVPLYLLIAAGLMHFRRGPAYGVCLAFLLASNLWGLRNYYWIIPEPEAWDQAAHYVAQHVHAGDLILFNANFVQLPFDYYLHRYMRNPAYNRPVVEHGVPSDFLGQSKETAIEPRLKALVGTNRRVWLVYNRYQVADPLGQVPATLDRMGHLIDRWVSSEGSEIGVYLYEI